MPNNDLQVELKAFERDLARLVARFMRLCTRLEQDEPPSREPPALVRKPGRNEGPLVPGYQ